MTTYVGLKLQFQKLSEIEVFRKSKGCGVMLIWIIKTCPWWYIWCWKQHSIIVAGFQQKCCLSAPNVDFSWIPVIILIHVKIGNQRKKQHLLPENNNFVRTSNIDVLLLHMSFISSGSSKNLSDALLNLSTHVLERFLVTPFP